MGHFLSRKFILGANSTESPPSLEREHPSVLLATATTADDNSNNRERPSRWSRARGRARKRSPSARQRASASVIRRQDCSPPPVQRDRPPTPPSMEDSSTPSPPPAMLATILAQRMRACPQGGAAFSNKTIRKASIRMPWNYHDLGLVPLPTSGKVCPCCS